MTATTTSCDWEGIRRALGAEARRGGMDIDVDAYRSAGRNPHDPVLLGSGSCASSFGFFGRDPGRTEAQTGEPFVGKGGQLIRGALFRLGGGAGQPSLEASIEAGRNVFWANTVPFKPVGNKAWSMPVKRRFAPLIAHVLTACWTGTHLITLGNEAFFWFSIAEPNLKPELVSFWSRADRYEARLDISFLGKNLSLYPLPHPSPRNATWFRRFPELLDRRLAAF